MIIALICQLLLLPAICFGLVLAFRLPPVLAVGMMLLAASPGGTTANLYSHLFRGDVALNISLTAINSVIAVLTLPLIVNFAIGYFMAGDDQIDIQFARPSRCSPSCSCRWCSACSCAAGAGFADAMDKPVRIASVVILVVVIAGAIVVEPRGAGREFRALARSRCCSA